MILFSVTLLLVMMPGMSLPKNDAAFSFATPNGKQRGDIDQRNTKFEGSDIDTSTVTNNSSNARGDSSANDGKSLATSDIRSDMYSTSEKPNLTTPEPNVNTLKPNFTTIELNVTTLAPSVTTLEHNVTTTEPNVTTLEPIVTSPEPNVTTLELNVTTTEPNVTTLEPIVTSPEPNVTTLELNVTTSEPNVTTSEPSVTPFVKPCTSTEQRASAKDAEFVRLVGHRYEGVVVHIDDGVPFSESLLQNIQMLFKETQAALEFATRPPNANEGGLTFGSVFITVPSNWEKDFPVPPVSLGSPSVRVEPPSPSHGHVPYTLQPGGCGERGLYIHLTPEFVNNMFNKSVKDRIGQARNVLVHEWAHLRWGVFDEYVAPDVFAHPHLSLARPFFFDDTGHVKPSVCPLNIKGWVVEEVHGEGPVTSLPTSNGSSETTILKRSLSSESDKRNAQVNDATPSLRLCNSFTPKGLPAPHCFFYSDPKQETKGSLMGYFSSSQLLSEGKRFCGDRDDVVRHDSAAPTPHNLRCGGRSVWEVMRQHDDFASHCGHHRRRLQAPPVNPSTSTFLQDPSFIFYKRQTPKNLLLILDCSQLPNDTLSSIKNDLLRFLETFVPKDTKVLAVTSQSLAQGLEDLGTEHQPANNQLAALTCEPGGNDQAALAAADRMTRSAPSHLLVLTFMFSPDRVLYDRLSTRLPIKSALHAVTLEQACPDELLKTSERRFSCTKHRNGDDLSETLRGVWASHSAEEGLTQVYAQSLSLQPAGRPGDMASVSGQFFLNFCQGSSLLSVFAPTRVLGKNPSSVDMTLVHDGVEAPLSQYKPKLYTGADWVNVVVKIPCDSAHGDWEYVIRTPTPAPPTVHKGLPVTKLTVDVKVYQHEDEDTAVRMNTFILVKKRLSRNCTELDRSSSNSRNYTNNATKEDQYNGTKMVLAEESTQRTYAKVLSNHIRADTKSPVTSDQKLKSPPNLRTAMQLPVVSEPKSSLKCPSRDVHAEDPVVESTPKESGEQPEVHGGKTISYNDSLLRIVSVLTQGGKGERTPVLGASVTAFVSREDSPDSVQVPLQDSGIAADEIADDGIYSGFLTGIAGDGRYSVSVEATDGKSSRRRISTIRQKIFWDQHQQETDSSNISGTDLYRLKVRCSSAHTEGTLRVQQQSEGSAETAALLVVLESDNHEGSSSGRMYSGKATITHSGKLIVPRGCNLISVIGQGEGAPDRPASSSHQGSPGGSQRSPSYVTPGSSAPLQPIVMNPNQTFDSPSTDVFNRHLPAQDNDGGEERISKERNVKEKKVLELAAETSRFRVKRAVERIEVVGYTSRDITPPGRVRNLNVTKVHYMPTAVTLEWSSPGDDLYSGTAHRIDLRYHHIRESLLVEFQTASPVKEGEHVAHGALTPLPAMQTQRVTIILKNTRVEEMETDITFHFGLIVWDEMDNGGGVSNLAEARFTVAEREEEFKAQNSSKQLMGIAFSVMLAVLGIVLVLVGFAKIKEHLHKRMKADCYDVSYLDLTTTTKFGTNPRSRSRESTKAGGESRARSPGKKK